MSSPDPHIIEPPYEYIRSRLAERKVIPFLGAGASLIPRIPIDAVWRKPDSEFLPKSNELSEYLERLIGYPVDEACELTRVAQYMDGVTGRGGLEEELHAIFARTYVPTELHLFLADFPQNLLIVTTNYDTLIECAFEARHRAYDLVVYNTNAQTFLVKRHGSGKTEHLLANEFVIDLDAAPTIFKMHGTADAVDPENESYLITEDDYVDFLVRMANKTAIPAPLAEPFRKSHFLFLGYGLRDWNLRVILHKIWKEWPRRYASWAVQHRALPLEREFWNRRSLTIYELTITSFLQRLKES